MYFGCCQAFPGFWIFSNPIRVGRKREGALTARGSSMRWTHCRMAFQSLVLKTSVKSTSWFHCQPRFSQAHCPGQSADMASSFHSPQSRSSPFQHLGSLVHDETNAQRSLLQESHPAHWWWFGGGPCRWVGQEGRKREGPMNITRSQLLL